MSLPRPLDPFVALAQALRRAGLAASPEQTAGFIAAVGLLGPRDMTDIWRAGRALFSIPPERVAEYDALFRAIFLGQTVALPAEGEDESVEAHEPSGAARDVDEGEETDAGGEAVAAERLARREIAPGETEAALIRLSRAAPALPRRLSYRHRRTRRGPRPDMRRVLREAARRDGDVPRLFFTRRKTRARRILLLIDVSGSMKERTTDALRLAHVLVQVAERAEVFTLGTRLTRVTAPLRLADASRALARTAEAVADFDGGTRIGEALAAYLAVPRYAGFARGAAVVVLSDGLERGDPGAMVDAVTRLSRLAWTIRWLSPLAADPGYRPETAGMRGIAPLVRLGDGAGAGSIVEGIMTLAREGRAG